MKNRSLTTLLPPAVLPVLVRALVLCAAVLVASPLRAAVGPEKGGVAVGASLGAALPFESDYKTGWTLAGTFDYYFSNDWGVRATLGYLGLGTKLEGTTDPNSTYLLASAVWTGKGEKVRPYALGGIGLYVFEPSVGGRSGRAGLHAGGGVEFSLARRWSVTGEGLFHFVSDAGEKKTSFFGLSGGFRYRF